MPITSCLTYSLTICVCMISHITTNIILCYLIQVTWNYCSAHSLAFNQMTKISSPVSLYGQCNRVYLG